MAEVLIKDSLETYSTDSRVPTKNVKVGLATVHDTAGITALLEACRVGVPTLETMGGVHLVAKDDDKIVGYVWALVGNGDIAYIDFLAVHPDYRSKNSTNEHKVSLQLCEGMRYILEEMGITQLICLAPPYKKELVKLYQTAGFLEVEGKYFVMRKLN